MSNSGNTPSSALAAARALDAQGRPADAAQALLAATRSGDLLAMSELAHRLLVGNGVTRSAQHALYLLTEAAERGASPALTRLAALATAGAYVKKDWPGALRMLGQAASAGDESARGQLISLQPPDAAPADWPEMAARVPLDFWEQAAADVPLHQNVRRVPALVPSAVCTWLIGRARGRLQRAIVYDAVSRTNLAHEMRTNSMALFDYATLDVVQYLVQARMARTCGYPMQHCELPMILHYAVGQQITPHFDFIDAQASDYARQIHEQGQRMVTFLLYLNDSYEGGETTFPELKIVHRGTHCDGLYFINAHPDLAPDRRMLHTGSPPLSGEKWIVSQFIVSKKLRP